MQKEQMTFGPSILDDIANDDENIIGLFNAFLYDPSGATPREKGVSTPKEKGKTTPREEGETTPRDTIVLEDWSNDDNSATLNPGQMDRMKIVQELQWKNENLKLIRLVFIHGFMKV